MTYKSDQKVQAAAWKATTVTLPPEAKHPAPYRGGTGPPHDFCLPIELADLSLLDEARQPVLELFARRGIPWHHGRRGHPSNHLLSSQVHCANALGQMINDPDRIVRAFDTDLDIAEVLQIDDAGGYLTFEFVPDRDYLHEGRLTPGANCTSVDAAFRYRTSTGDTALALIEWKYVEEYSTLHTPHEASDAKRTARYKHLLDAPDSPVRNDLLPFADLLTEPLYQLMRQQLLAHEIEKDHTSDVQRVTVLHVSPPANLAYQRARIVREHPELGDTVHETWHRLLCASDRFITVDCARFDDPTITSREYRVRYGREIAFDRAALQHLAESARFTDIAELLDTDGGFDGDVEVSDTGVELVIGAHGTMLAYPFPLSELRELAAELQDEAT